MELVQLVVGGGRTFGCLTFLKQRVMSKYLVCMM